MTMTVTDTTRPTAPAESLASATTLTGRWLTAARVASVFALVGLLATFVMRLPIHYDSLSHACPDVCSLNEQQGTLLTSAGISLTTYAWISVALVSAIVLTSTALALILFWRRSQDWMVLLVAIFLVAYPIFNIATSVGQLSDIPTPLQIVLLVSQLPLAPAYLATLLLFPNGRFVPRWTWLLLIPWTILVVIPSFLPDLYNQLDGLLFLASPLFSVIVIILQVYRYRRASTPAQRQQTKWAVTGLATVLVASLFWLPAAFTPLGETLYVPISYLLYQLVVLALPITFFIAIQRHRLYDIDTILNRTLVYGSVTLVLVGVYVGLIVAFQGVSRALLPVPGRADEPIVIVVSTLLIAALFQPLRKRIQRAVDRRFYRTRYDARKAVESFGTALRQEVDITTFREQLLGVVQQTMEPAHLSLWLSAAPDRRTAPPKP